MMPCQDVRDLIEEHLAGTLDSKRRRALTAHLKTCPNCHRAVEEARLAGMVLREASKLPPPPDLAVKIKSAARFRILNRPRPLHERALGSPAFLATCASLLCGAIICLSAIVRVGSVSVERPDPQLAARSVEVHSLVTVQRAKPPAIAAAKRRPPALREVAHVERQAAMTRLVRPHSHEGPATPRLRPLGYAQVAGTERPLALHNARHEADEAASVALAPAVQRTSMPGSIEPASMSDRPNLPALTVPTADKSEVAPATSFISEATVPSGDQR